jgi:hypothetical protein
MMQSILDHIARVVRPALRKYTEAENALTVAVLSNDTMAVDAAGQDVMLAARGAATVLHHLSDFVFKEPSPSMQFKNLEEIRRAISEKCVFLRTTSFVPDVWHLRDVADAFKHHRLDRTNTRIRVSTRHDTRNPSGLQCWPRLPRRRAMARKDPLVERMEIVGIPVTRENYIEQNWAGLDMPAEWTAEHEDMLPGDMQRNMHR